MEWGEGDSRFFERFLYGCSDTIRSFQMLSEPYICLTKRPIFHIISPGFLADLNHLRGRFGWLDMWGSQGYNPQRRKHNPRKFNSEFTPEKMVGKEDDPFRLGPGLFSGAFPVKLRRANLMTHHPSAQASGLPTQTSTTPGSYKEPVDWSGKSGNDAEACQVRESNLVALYRHVRIIVA